jgi:hypothetical protein
VDGRNLKSIFDKFILKHYFCELGIAKAFMHLQRDYVLAVEKILLSGVKVF